jgi:hypothetical protein
MLIGLLLLPWTTYDHGAGRFGVSGRGEQSNGLFELGVVLLRLPLSPILGAMDGLPLCGTATILLAGLIGVILVLRRSAVAWRGIGWDLPLLVLAYFISVTWLWVLELYLIGRDATYAALSFGYTALLPGFWLVPIALVAAALLRVYMRRDSAPGMSRM